jgi:hypothetical protein
MVGRYAGHCLAMTASFTSAPLCMYRTSPTLNILLYNAIGGSGDELYGIEPASYYVKNLLLNMGVAWPLVLLSPLVYIVSCSLRWSVGANASTVDAVVRGAVQPVGGNSDASSGANTLGRTAPALDPMGGAIKKQFVLPDFHTVLKGYVKPDDEPSDPTEQVCGYVFASYDVPVEGPLQLSDVRKDTARLIAVDFPSRCWLWRQSASACRNCFLTRGTSVS